MNVERIFFIAASILILGSAFMVVTTRKLIQAALWLVSALFGVTILYAMLQANFLAVVQVVVYIGAISVLFIFAVMLTRKELRDQGTQTRTNWWISALLGGLIFAGLVFLIIHEPTFNRSAESIPLGLDTLRNLGTALVSPGAYVLPFEAASVLLLGALIGAVYIASRKVEDK